MSRGVFVANVDVLRRWVMVGVLVVALMALGAQAVGAAGAIPARRAPAPSGDVHLVAVLKEGEPVAADRAVETVAEFDGHARVLPHSGTVAVTVPQAAAAPARAALTAQPTVEYVEDDVVIGATRTPDDPGFREQWALPRIDAPNAWDRTVGSADVSIAVLDTGVERNHPDLAANIGRRYDVVGNGEAHDRQGHGTKSAGVAAAVTDNGIGVAGVCWRCEIWPVKVMSDDGSGRHSHVAEGVRWAASNGADVINLSLGGHGRTAVLEAAVNDAVAAGSVVVASAGNFGTTEPVYPAAYDNVIAVGAINRDGQRANYSSHGEWVAAAAPGCTPTTSTGGGTGNFCGTSAAAPQVSGIAGLIRSVHGAATPAEVRAALTEGADAIGQGLGAGRVDAAESVSLAEQRRGSPGADDPDDDRTSDDGEVDGGPGGGERLIDSLTRVVGTDRFATAAQLSAARLEPGVARAYLVTGTSYPDALAAGAVAGAIQAPVLLATRDQLPTVTATELSRLGPEEVVVVGGEGAIGEAVAAAAAAAADAPVRRVSGADRFATAAAIADSSFSGPLGVVFLASGEGFADALAGIPAAVVEGAPMLLTAQDDLPAPTRRTLRGLAPRRVVIVGGEQAVSRRVHRQLRTAAPTASIQRLAGRDRFATAAAIAAAIFDPEEVEEVALATGQAFPDALAAGPVAGSSRSPLLLLTREQVPDATLRALRHAGPSRAWVAGGPTAVSERVTTALRRASSSATNATP